MFKKKVWKRGDKLNAKELNRIEEGIATAGEPIIITGDFNVELDEEGKSEVNVANLSKTVNEIVDLLTYGKKIEFQLNYTLDETTMVLHFSKTCSIAEGFHIFQNIVQMEPSQLTVFQVQIFRDGDDYELSGRMNTFTNAN